MTKRTTILLSILLLQSNEHIYVTMLICCYFNSWIRPSILSSRLVENLLPWFGSLPIDRIHFRNQLLDITREFIQPWQTTLRELLFRFIPLPCACIQRCMTRVSRNCWNLWEQKYITNRCPSRDDQRDYIRLRNGVPFHGNLNSFWRYS